MQPTTRSLKDLLLCTGYGLLIGLCLLLLAILWSLASNLIDSLVYGIDERNLNINLSNAGIRKSLRNACCWAVVGTVSAGIVLKLCIVLLTPSWDISPDDEVVLFALILTLTFLIIGRLFGGAACMQHVTLRIVLYQQSHLPWNYARFLNYSTERYCFNVSEDDIGSSIGFYKIILQLCRCKKARDRTRLLFSPRQN